MKWICALWAVVFMVMAAEGRAAEAQVRRGDYEIRLAQTGLEVLYKGTRIVCGSQLTLFRPDYTGNYYAAGDLAGRPTVRWTADKTGITVTDAIPEFDGEVRYRAEVDAKGVLTTLHIKIGKAIPPSPCEYGAALLPPGQFAGGAYSPVSLLGASGWKPLPKEAPRETGPGTHLLSSDLYGMRLRGGAVEVTMETPSGPRPFFYDMRSRDYPAAQKTYWLLYQMPVGQGETVVRTRLSARKSAAPESAAQKGRVRIMQGKASREMVAIALGDGAHVIEKEAAGMLQGYLERMGAAWLPVLDARDTALPEKGVLFVGRSRAALSRGLYTEAETAEMEPDAFIARSREGNVLLLGGGYRGTAYAVSRFLERLGCRFYADELEVIPRKKSVSIPDSLEVADSPAFEWRAMWGSVDPIKSGLSPGEWEAKVGDADVPKMMAIPKGGFWHHTIGFLLPARDLAEKHPEYLAMLGGERKVVEPAVQQYCLSNPEFLQLLTRRVLQWMDEDPDPVYYPVHYGDVANFCECDACKSMYAEKGSVSDAVIWFLNEIAAKAKQSHPDKFLTILAYWGTRRPPVNVKPASNLLIVFCAISECQARPWSAPINRKLHVMDDLERWIAIHPLGPKGIITFEYPCTYFYVGYPYPALYAFAENLRYYKRLGLRGVYICGLTRGHLLNVYSYAMSRLLWNPDQPLDALIGEFADAWYGRAAGPMRDYIDTLHRAAMNSQSEGVMDCHAGPGQRFFRELMTPEFLRKLYGYFEKAEAQAGSDLTRRRIANDKWGLLFVDLFLHGRAGSDLVPTEDAAGFRVQSTTEQDYRKMAELLRLTQQFNRPWVLAPHVRFSLSAIIGFEPSASPWWDSPEVKAIMDDPAGAFRKSTPQRDAAARQLVSLENDRVKALLAPALGGRIWRFYAKDIQADLFWRGTLPWHLLQTGGNPAQAFTFGGYEEYTGEKWGTPGWAERYDCQLSEDRRSAVLTAKLPNGLKVTRAVRLLDDGLEVSSSVRNESAATVPAVALRAHPQFVFKAGQPGLALAVRRQGGWQEQPVKTETWLRGEGLPQGAWGVRDKDRGVSILNEFDPAQVQACYLYVHPAGESYNLEVFSKARDLAPGESLELTHRYRVEKR
ncbi:MAG: DUF4838 domain-containing protein [Armatimonadetes bacterium]|nr:DUF4838 domain-containing protein [Armatimonadota bacterium]